MSWQIVPIERRHIAGFREVLDGVARERRYLVFLEAPPAAEVRRFVLGNLRNGVSQFVAVEDGQVVGWCDVVPKTREALRHSGVLGMGVAATHRSRGIGAALLQAAIALYRRFGFEPEGRFRNYMIVDNASHDVLAMARHQTGGNQR
jgi:GNAT superfamily N-acetyltransferase